MDIEKILKEIPPAPPGVEDWTRNLARKTYLIYDKKQNIAVCTRCGTEHELGWHEPKHKEKMWWLGCCREGEFEWRSAGMGRKSLAEYERVLTFAAKNGIIYAVLNEVVIDFTPLGKPDLLLWPSAVYTIAEKEQHYYKNNPWRGWEERKKNKIPSVPSPYNWYSSSKWDRTSVYKENIKEVFEMTHLRHSYDDELIEKMSADELLRYCVLETKNKSMEILRKSGFKNLIYERVREAHSQQAVNWRGKTLQKILRLPMNHIRKIREFDLSLYELQIFQMLTDKEKKEVTRNELAEFSKMFKSAITDIQNIAPLLKFLRYWENQGLNALAAGDYLDYINGCKKIGFDINKKDVLFPKDFKKAHDEVIEQVESVTNAQLDLAIKAATFEFGIENETLTCHMARSQSGLNKESRVLNHCVRTYGDKIIRGKSLIFFIRKKEEPGQPYYTLELDPAGNFVQCRGLRNCLANEEVEKFVQKIIKEFNKTKNKRRKAT